jgi:sec-independent protein translocase protein TatA
MSLGPLEIGLIVLLIALVFGAKRLPALGRAVGQSMREFKGGISGEKSDDPAELGAPEEPKGPDGDTPSRS